MITQTTFEMNLSFETIRRWGFRWFNHAGPLYQHKPELGPVSLKQSDRAFAFKGLLHHRADRILRLTV